jgi:cell division protease FtsH
VGVIDAWLPLGQSLPGGQQSRAILFDAPDWQIYETASGGRALIAKAGVVDSWIAAGIVDSNAFSSLSFGDQDLRSFTSPPGTSLYPLSQADPPRDKKDALAFIAAMTATRAVDAKSPLQDALYAQAISRLLPTNALAAPVGDDVVLGTWLTGGVPVSVLSTRRLHSLVGWMGRQHLDDVVARAGFTPGSDEAKKGGAAANKRFSLAGRPELEGFLTEHVIDIIENEARYRALGIDFPSAIVLHGPPGCGKTFAVERLIEHLGWPSYSIDASSVASPYIHETSKKVAAVFDKAMENAPSVVVIDEMEAFLSDRQTGATSGHHRVEEVSEFLRRIPEAIKNRVLIIAMTNVIEMIDPAILRRGRFDHVIKVDMASEPEVRSLLLNLLDKLPRASNIDVAELAKSLTGRPLSDVSFVVREAARLAAKAGKQRVDQESVASALASTAARGAKPAPRKIGFT